MKRLLFLLLCSAAFAQGVRYDLPPILNARGQPIANAQITLCTGVATISGSNCTGTAQSFTDITVVTQCAAGSPVTLTNSSVCQATGDALGNAGFWLSPGAYIYCVNAPSTTGKCYNLTVPIGATAAGNGTLGGNSLTAGSATITGALTASTINGTIALDGTTYPLTVAGLQSALSACGASATCTGVDARQLGAVSGTTTTTLPANKGIWIGAQTVISGTSDPVICYNSASFIDGPLVGEGTLETVGAVKSTVGTSRVIAPCTPNPRTLYPYFRGVNFFNTAGSGSTAVVVDFTGVSQGRMDNNFIQRSTGTASLVLITPASGGDAFYNVFVGNKLFGSTTATCFDVENAANSQTIYGGKLDSCSDCLFVTGAAQTNDINVYGTACESQTAAVVHATVAAKGIKWYGGRMESNGVSAVVSNIDAAAGVADITYYSPFVAGSQTRGTENGKVSWYGSGHEGFPAVNLEVLATGNIQAASFTNANSTTQSLFQNSTSGVSPLAVSTDGLTNGNGLAIIDSHAGGHTWTLAEEFAVGRLEFRDNTQTGQPGWSFAVTGTASAEGIFTHANTASRSYAMPDVTGTVGINFNSLTGTYQSKRGVTGCTTTGGASAFTGACTTAVTFPASFPDANFSCVCQGRSTFTGVPLLQGATATAVNSCTVQTQQATGVNASFATIDCIAIHD